MWAWTPWFAILILVCSAARTKEGQVSRDNFEVIPDLQLYPRNMKGPEALTASQAKLLQQRVARCYNPRASREYSDVQWQPALDKYTRGSHWWIKEGAPSYCHWHGLECIFASDLAAAGRFSLEKSCIWIGLPTSRPQLRRSTCPITGSQPSSPILMPRPPPTAWISTTTCRGKIPTAADSSKNPSSRCRVPWLQHGKSAAMRNAFFK